MSSERGNIHFPGLNGLRFLAAVFVIVTHVEQFKGWFGYASHFRFPPIYHAGTMGVSLFFVLSGFLITYLLLKEQELTGTISVRRFYVRRILRIWPLYYLTLFAVFVVVPVMLPDLFWSEGIRHWFIPMTILHALILPNLSYLAFPVILGGSHLWSIGVEEQFYVVWPFLMKTFARRVPALLAGLLLAKIALNEAAGYVSVNAGSLVADAGAARLLKFAGDAMLQFEIEKMTVGGIGAYLLYGRREPWLRALYHPGALVFAAALCVVRSGIILSVRVPSALEALAYAVIIMNVCRTPGRVLDNPLMERLGQVSYGIYMWHPMAILAALLILKPLFGSATLLFNTAIYVLALALSIGAALLSYYLFEKRFLVLKDRFSFTRRATT